MSVCFRQNYKVEKDTVGVPCFFSFEGDPTVRSHSERIDAKVNPAQGF